MAKPMVIRTRSLIASTPFQIKVIWVLKKRNCISYAKRTSAWEWSVKS